MLYTQWCHIKLYILEKIKFKICNYKKCALYSINESHIYCGVQRIKIPHVCVTNTLILIGLSFQVVFISSFPSQFQRSLHSIYKSNMTEISKSKMQQLNEYIIMQSHISQFIYPINKKIPSNASWWVFSKY